MTATDSQARPAANWLLYDGECPFCSSYVGYVRLRDAVGTITLADARQHPALVAESRALGYDIDVGMVLKLDGRYYFGGDCIHALSLLTTPSGIFNRLNRALFRSRRVARIAYPLLRAGRNLALVVLGRQRIGSVPIAISEARSRTALEKANSAAVNSPAASVVPEADLIARPRSTDRA